MIKITRNLNIVIGDVINIVIGDVIYNVDL